MLHLNHITLTQFKNYGSNSFNFTQKIIAICGNNGTGKTNLLDSIFTLSFTKSYFTKSDAQNIQNGYDGFRIEGNYQLFNHNQLLTYIFRNNKKEFSENGTLYKKYSDHIGKYPCVMIAPDDVELITGGSELRRKFIDTILSQISEVYLSNLIQYNKVLQQRNSLLKQAAEQNKVDETLLHIYNHQLAEHGVIIFEQRQIFCTNFLPLILDFYEKIALQKDAIDISYESQLLQNNFSQLLQNNLQKDILLQRTTSGVHRDDLNITMSNNSFKQLASQGQRKSLLFALKLAEWQTLKQQKNFAPILLLDDIFEKLDEQRMFNLLSWVCKEDDGQVFITDTHKDRLTQALNKANINFQLIEL